MVNEIALDVENVFHWRKGPEEEVADAGRLAYIRMCVDALAWWSDVHHGPGEAAPAQVDVVHGYGKLDPAGQAFTSDLLAGSPADAVRVDRITEFRDPGHSPRGTRVLILDVDHSPGVSGLFTLVDQDKHAAEVALLEDVEVAVGGTSGHRIVLGSLDNKVTTFYGNRDRFPGVSLLLVYNGRRRPEHVGDAGVATLGQLTAVYENLSRVVARLEPGAEITGELLTRLELLANPGPPTRPNRTGRLRVIAAPARLASPVETLRHVDWDALVEHRPDSPQWVSAWGNRGFQLTASRVIHRELTQISRLDDELARWVEGLLGGERDDALAAYGAFALIAAHYLLPAEDRVSLGAAIRSDPELSARLWRPYVLIQPYLAPDAG